MPKYVKKPIVVEAHQWFKNGDHPDDQCVVMHNTSGTQLSEGKVVRYFYSPYVPGNSECFQCKKTMHIHGFIDTLEGGHSVCPGDFVITGIKGEHYPCKPDIFLATYDEL